MIEINVRVIVAGYIHSEPCKQIVEQLLAVLSIKKYMTGHYVIDFSALTVRLRKYFEHL